MTHVPIDFCNYRVFSQIVASFLINIAKSKHNHYVECNVHSISGRREPDL
jgi:hypothetical protein